MAAVCVYCASATRIDPSYVELAEQVGVELARRGHSLVSGGGKLSMMGAVARGALVRRSHADLAGQDAPLTGVGLPGRPAPSRPPRSQTEVPGPWLAQKSP